MMVDLKIGNREDRVMKKTIAILSAFAALVSCTKEAPVVEEPTQEQNQTIKVNFNISRTDITNDTKATVKTTWADNDVVFIFFEDVAAPKYLELKYNSGNWTPTQCNGLVAGNLAASGKHLTAVYLPYGSNFTVAADGTSFTIKNGENNYSGHFFVCEKAVYSFADGTLTATISLSAAAPLDGDDRLVHFDVTGYTDGHEYDMYQDYMKPFSLTSIASDGTVSKTVGSKGDAISGYIDAANTIVSFSGVLDKSAKTEKDWQFSINDVTASVLYTRDAGNKTISANKYIGLGNISTATWNANEYVYLGFTNFKGERVMWAKKNLGATSETGEGSVGRFYYWGDLVGHAVTGSYPSYSVVLNPLEDEEYKLPAAAPVIDFTHFEAVGEHYQMKLKPEYDPAHVALKGLWRMPTAYTHPNNGNIEIGELGLLKSNTTRTKTGAFDIIGVGKTCTGPNGNSIFLPYSGYVINGTVTYSAYDVDYPDWYMGDYISSVCILGFEDGHTIYFTNTCHFLWNGGNKKSGGIGFGLNRTSGGHGFSIRPVFSIK